MELPFEHDALELLEACAAALNDIELVSVRTVGAVRPNAGTSGAAQPQTPDRSAGAALLRYAGEAGSAIGQTAQDPAIPEAMRQWSDPARMNAPSVLHTAALTQTEYVFREAPGQASAQLDVEAVSRAVERDARRFDS